MSHCRRIASSFAIVLLSLSQALPARADLAPEEIAIVAARGNRESLGLARYYCKQRGVPVEQIIEVDVPAGETLDREKWRWAVRPQISKWLDENDPDGRLRCLVTTWGIPLKIDAGKPSDVNVAYTRYVTSERDARLERLEKIAALLDELAGGDPLSDAIAGLPDAEGVGMPNSSTSDIRTRLESALRAAQRRLSDLPPKERQVEDARLQQLATAAGGSRVLLQSMNQRIQGFDAAGQDVPLRLRQQFEVLRGRDLAFSGLRQLLDSRPPSFDRDDLAIRMLEQTGGLLATIDWLDEQAAVASRNERGASVDSELSLVRWSDGYELLRWQPNYLRGSFEGSQLRDAFPTLMVARLDGPDLPTAKRLIDDAIAVEKAGGLAGKAYIDARGLTTLDARPQAPGSAEDIDRTLLITAKGLEGLEDADGEPRFDVVLNEQTELFMPGQCPDTALYCGWYSLGKYVDAFDFAKGAIAFHLSSAEAVTLKELDSQAWCRMLLKDGVAATIGPVDEPYLKAFPRPDEFFALLVQGKAPLAEVYYQTKPFNSWQMVLIGDPLYRPYAR